MQRKILKQHRKTIPYSKQGEEMIQLYEHKVSEEKTQRKHAS